MKQELVIFGEDWGKHPSSTQHLALRLSQYYTITYINSVGLRAPKFNLNDLNRIFSKLKSFFVKTQSVKTSTPFTVISLPALPFHGFSLARRINAKIWASKLSFLKDKKPILWLSLPSALPIIGQLNESQVIYYCGDDFGGLAGVDHKPVLALEESLSQKADVIFTVSEQLSNKFPHDKTQNLPHGVDYQLFATPAPRSHFLPQGKPIAGFYGSISNWLDVEMVVKAANELPQWNFVFVGDIHTDVKSLKALNNVTFIEAQPHHTLPSLVQHFDVALLPFVDNAQIRACNPLKLREYLASGTPVVSSSFPALAPYLEQIEVCDTHNLAACIVKASETKHLKNARQESVAHSSWEARAAFAHSIMEQSTC